MNAGVSKGLPTSVTELVPDTLYRIGDSIPLNRPLSWYPSEFKGWLPINAYVLRDGDKALIIDTGITIHKQQVNDGLRAVLHGTTHRGVSVTRREPDAVINLPWILREFDVSTIHFGGDMSPTTYFETLEEATGEAYLKALDDQIDSEPELTWIRPGMVVEIGGLSVHVLSTSMRVLTTFWYYEERTRTLFSSDSWGFLTQPAQNSALRRTPARNEISPEHLVSFLEAKFDWLLGADVKPLAEALRKLIAERPIERICPTYGCIIEGAAAVQQVFDATFEALERMGRQKRPSALVGMDRLDAALARL